MVRIRSEHAIGYLKGRFQSLKSLRVNIKDEASHKMATYWVAACVAVHNFALACEDDERADDEDEAARDRDPFIIDGLSSASDSDLNANLLPDSRRPRGSRLAAGKRFREQLRDALLRSKDRRRQRREDQQ
jgi:hypothetical protein